MRTMYCIGYAYHNPITYVEFERYAILVGLRVLHVFSVLAARWQARFRPIKAAVPKPRERIPIEALPVYFLSK